MKFREYTMESVLDSIIDYRGKTPKKSINGIPTLSAKSVKNNHIDYSECYFISESEYKKFMVRGFPQKGDVLLTTEAPMGLVARLDRNGVAVAQRLLTIRGKKDVLDNGYLLYLLQSPYGQSLLKAKETGTTVTGIKQSEFRKIVLRIPDLETQKKIAKVLSALDDKIELNNQINKNLEEQAQALYKSWFVDFEPFGGVVPKNWYRGKIKDILKLNRHAIKPGENAELPYLPIDVIPMNTLAVTEFRPNEEAKSSLVKFAKNDIIIGAMRVYFHRVVIAPCDGITRTTCFTLTPYDENYLSFALLCCNQNEVIEYAQATSKGSTMPYAVWENGLGDKIIIIPPCEVASKFNDLVLPVINQIQSSYFENHSLKLLRDTLLPKLMSGEIDVDNVEI